MVYYAIVKKRQNKIHVLRVIQSFRTVLNQRRSGSNRGRFAYEGNMIIDTTHPEYIAKWRNAGPNRFNGAYYYSLEIGRNIIPNVRTDRNWITINVKGVGASHSIVFVHNNKRPENYEWLRTYGYKDLILVCGIPETCEKLQHIGTPIYLPLSIDVAEVEQYQVDTKTKELAFAGRKTKRDGIHLPDGIDYLENLPRDELLGEMAQYKTIYAVGRTALEARALGCKIKTYDPRFKSAARWKVLDNKDAAKILQKKLDEIDGVK